MTGSKRLAALLLALLMCLSLLAAPALADSEPEEAVLPAVVSEEPLPAGEDQAEPAADIGPDGEEPVPEEGTLPAEDGYPPALRLPRLTGAQSVDTAAIAVSQIGYTAEDGTVYGHWWEWRSIYWWRDYTHTEWCGVFAAWCAHQAGAGINVAFDEDAALVDSLFAWLKNNAAYDTGFSEDPRPGDFMFFGYSNGKAGHVVIVTDYDPAQRLVTYVGGNQSNPDIEGGGTKTDGRVVSQKSIEWSPDARDALGRRILGWGRPNYNDAPHVTAGPGAARILQGAVGLAEDTGLDPADAAALLRIYR